MLTGVIAVVVTSVKFVDGAFLVVLMIPTLVGIMLFIRRQYDGQATELAVRDDLVFERPHREQRVVVPVNGINRSVVQAVMFGKSLARPVDAPGRVRDRPTSRRPSSSAPAGSASCRACRWSWSSRRTGRSSGRS